MVAYFWRLDPAAILALPLSEFLLYESQAHRINQAMKEEIDG